MLARLPCKEGKLSSMHVKILEYKHTFLHFALLIRLCHCELTAPDTKAVFPRSCPVRLAENVVHYIQNCHACLMGLF